MLSSPGAAAYRLLRANTDGRPNVQAHNFGLYSRDATLPLYRGKYDSGMSSVAKSESTRERASR